MSIPYLPNCFGRISVVQAGSYTSLALFIATSSVSGTESLAMALNNHPTPSPAQTVLNKIQTELKAIKRGEWQTRRAACIHRWPMGQ